MTQNKKVNFPDGPYDHKTTEPKWSKFWEDKKFFEAKIAPGKKPFTIILPPPNANDPLHIGHAMYVIEDIMVRYHRQKGDPTLWLPGADHAGIETQFVFEKKLAKEGKSRFQMSREEFYQAVWDYVQENKSVMENQLKKLGFSLDWSREKFTLDPNIVDTILNTFFQLHRDGLVYKGNKIVNYCTKCGTAYSDLEVKYLEQTDPLYYMKYGPFILATVRPETKFGDTAVAVHPDDKRYQKFIGQTIEFEGLNGPVRLKVLADPVVDPKFGTGVVKVTPAHDPNDFEMGLRHHLPVNQVIGFDGRLNEKTGKYAGLKIKEAREVVVKDLQAKGLLKKVDPNYRHSVGVCYKCGTTIEPMIMPQWFLKMKPLSEPAIKAVRDKQIKIIPKRYEGVYFNWLENIKDWPITRQNWWGIQLPVWYSLEEIGGQAEDYTGSRDNEDKLRLAAANAHPYVSKEKPDVDKDGRKVEFIRDPDIYDTWFSSGQWPFATLGYPHSRDFEYFYPTTVMETGYDILFFWVARMIMLGLYRTGKVPFEIVYLHGLVRDKDGQKISKSKGNTIEPLEVAEKYGTDALRLALIYGTAPGGDSSMSEEKVRGMRNFTNKLWNIGRFVIALAPDQAGDLRGRAPDSAQVMSTVAKETEGRTRIAEELDNSKESSEIRKLWKETKKAVDEDFENYRFSEAAEKLYQFIWHEFADKYIESSKDKREQTQSTLELILKEALAMLHPFMPFITEELWQRQREKSGQKNWPESITINTWPII